MYPGDSAVRLGPREISLIVLRSRLQLRLDPQYSNECYLSLRSYSSLCGTITPLASSESAGTNQRKRTVAANAPINCAAINPGASAARMPAKVSVAALARVTAGLANDIDAVNQSAAT